MVRRFSAVMLFQLVLADYLSFYCKVCMCFLSNHRKASITRGLIIRLNKKNIFASKLSSPFVGTKRKKLNANSCLFNHKDVKYIFYMIG